MAVAPEVRAEDQAIARPPSRIGLVPLVGFGAAVLTKTGDLPGFIGFTSLGFEIHGERPPYGLLLRGQYLSSGKDGRWTAPSLSAGASWRLFGDGLDELSLIGRAGVLYDRWHATSSNTGCPVDLFFPTNCKALGPIEPSGVIVQKPVTESITVDAFGAFAGARLELPVSFFYAAIDAEMTLVGDVSSTMPGAIFSLRSGIAFGFRDRRGVEEKKPPPAAPHQPRRGATRNALPLANDL